MRANQRRPDRNRPIDAATGAPGDLDEDRRLLPEAQAGDRAALDQLLRAHQPRVYAICRRMIGNDTDALDATQEALIAIVRGIRTFDGRSRLTTWIYRVTVNACLDEVRRQRRRPVVGSDADLAEAQRSPSLMDDQVSARLDIDRALRLLDADFRAAVVLRDLCSLDYATIAEVLDIPAGTVRSRIARGRASLALHLGGNHDAPPNVVPTTEPTEQRQPMSHDPRA